LRAAILPVFSWLSKSRWWPKVVYCLVGSTQPLSQTYVSAGEIRPSLTQLMLRSRGSFSLADLTLGVVLGPGAERASGHQARMSQPCGLAPKGAVEARLYWPPRCKMSFDEDAMTAPTPAGPTAAHVPTVPAGWPRWRLLSARGSRSLANGMGLLALVSLVGAGVASGRWGAALAGVLAFAGCWTFLSVFVRLHRLPSDHKDWLASLCVLALALRVVLAVLILNGPWDYGLFGEDQTGYDYIPQALADSWSSDLSPSIYQANAVVEARKGYFNFVALQFYLFGPALIVPRVLNSLAGALIVFYGVSLVSRIFGAAEARIAGVWTAVFPSLMLWSAVNLRDIWLALSVLAIVFHAFILRDRFSALSLMAIIGNLLWIHFNREYLVFIMIVACIAIFVLARSTNAFRDVAVAVVLAGVLLVLYQSMGLGREGIEWLDLDRIAEQRERLARSDVGRSGYLGDIDVSSPIALVAAGPVLLVYFLFSPFPWQMTVARRLVIAPEMLFWYWLTPFVFFAFRHAIQARRSRQFALFMTLAVVTVAFAMPSANMGLAYRYRAQIVPMYLAFAAAGFVRRKVPSLAGLVPDRIPRIG
jgi:hypothetical protein